MLEKVLSVSISAVFAAFVAGIPNNRFIITDKLTSSFNMDRTDMEVYNPVAYRGRGRHSILRRGLNSDS